MKLRASGWTGLVLAVVMTACAPKDISPTIACDINGQVVSTAFTFNSFRAVLASEHGQIQVVTNALLKSKTLEVSFRRLGDGRLLAERAVVTGAVSREMPPAVLFGLTNAVAAPAAPVTVPQDEPATNR